MATSRLRHSFRYPDEDENEPDELDEQDQEHLIQSLRSHDSTTSDFYRTAFLPLPLISTLVYIPTIFIYPSKRSILLALLSVSSLLSTAYILHYIPPKATPAPDPKGKRPMYQTRDNGDGPVEQYLVLLNAVLSGAVAVAAMVAWNRGLAAEAWRGVLPAAIFGVVIIARTQMAPVPFDGLERLRYEYKGA